MDRKERCAVNKVWLYHRESTKEGAERADQHFEELRKAAEKNGYEVVGQSFDQDVWQNMSREGLLVAKAAVKDKKADSILVVGYRVIASTGKAILELTQDLGGAASLLVAEGDTVYSLDSAKLQLLSFLE